MRPRRIPAIARSVLLAALAGALTALQPAARSIAASTPPVAHDAATSAPSTDGARDRAEEGATVELFGIALAELTRALVLWIGRHAEHDVGPVRADPPLIVFAESGDTLDFGHGAIRIEPGLRGAYQHESRVVVLTLPWYLADPWDGSILLHELVHAVQLSSREWRCPAETEWEAHRLQRLWLAEHGIEMVADWLLVGILSRCPEATSGVDAAGPRR